LTTHDLTDQPDPSFDRAARIVREALQVPVALVSLVEPTRQVFPGSVGLPEPWQSQRSTPLSHSFCQYVVIDDAPLIISDAREDLRLCDNLAIENLSVIAYAGFPLRDARGVAIGSVCAIDSAARQWSEPELRMLEDIAAMCSTELALRESRSQLSESVEVATELSSRARALLGLSERLAETVTNSEIASALQDVAAKSLNCNHAGIWFLDVDAQTLSYVDHPTQSWPQAERNSVFALDAGNPIGAPLMQRRPLLFADRAAQDRQFPELASGPREGDGQARALMPLSVGGQPQGTLALLWEAPRDFSDDDRITIAALTSYTAQAVHRARLLDERSSVASTMQRALLTQLPQPDHLDIVARYRAASAHDEVGGDWYDAVVMPTGATNLMIGDVSGHDIGAAAVMGGLRNMLRALAWAIDEPPSANVTRLDQAARDMELQSLATLIFARIEQDYPHKRTGTRTLRWTNAGHPPPILVHSDGSCHVLDDGQRNLMLGVFPDTPRRDQTADIPPDATLVLYTDGLIETRDTDIDDGRARLLEALNRHHRLSAGDMLDAVLQDLVGDHHVDDVAVLAVGFNHER
jgi:serine phosphatase RsbU (regulator of sigma subunit)